MPIGTILIDLRDESFIFTELLYLNNNEIDSLSIAKLQTYQIC